jgi:2-oxoisovalerate dehydrogenase E1 component
MFNFFNNFYGMGGQTHGETMAWDMLARVGAGVNENNLHAERVDGYNPLAVADAVSRKRKVLEKGEGPVLMDTITYRISGHSPSDASSYRSKEEIDSWLQADAIDAYGEYLMDNKVVSESDLQAMRDRVKEKVIKAVSLATDEDRAPYVKAAIIEDVMFSNDKVERFDEREPEVLIPIEENPRVKMLSRRSRSGVDEQGNPLPANKIFAYRDALFESMLHRFYADPTMIAYGEETGTGGVRSRYIAASPKPCRITDCSIPPYPRRPSWVPASGMPSPGAG